MLGVWSVVSVSSSALGARFTVSLAERLALRGVRVLLFELAPELPSLDVLLGVSEKVVYTLADAREVTPERVLLTPCENLYFAPLGVGETVDEPASLFACMDEVKPDVVLLFAERSACSLARSVSDGMLLLTDETAQSLRSAAALTEKHAFDGYVLTDLVPAREWIGRAPALTEIADALGLPLFGILPRTDPNNTHLSSGKDFLSAVDNMAGRMMGEDIPLLRGIPTEGIRRKSFLARISK